MSFTTAEFEQSDEYAQALAEHIADGYPAETFSRTADYDMAYQCWVEQTLDNP